MAYIDESTEIKMSLGTGGEIAEALESVIASGYWQEDLYDLFVGCEWDAEAAADVLNAHPEMLYAHDWRGVRTLPRSLSMQGTDRCGNIENLRIHLCEGEPDMIEGFTLKISLTNPSRVPLSLSNMIAHGHTPDDFRDYMYDAAAEEWSAEAFAEAANRARYDGVIYDGPWEAKYTRDSKCCITGRDSFGNEHMVIIRAV